MQSESGAFGPAAGAAGDSRIEQDPPQDAVQIPFADAVAEPERIVGLDLARGFALLGIFLVNIQFFSEPFGRMIDIPSPPTGSSALDGFWFWFVLIFCSGKFYPLFSTLFGIGFMIQLERARRAERKFVPAYLRRIGFLCLLGLAHGLLLWYGDILFIYSFCAALLFGAVMIFKPGARGLLWTGVVLVVLSTLLGGAVNLVLGGGPPSAETDQVDSATTQPASTQPATAPSTQPATQTTEAATREAAATAPAPQERSPSRRLFAAMRANEVRQGPASPVWLETETEAYRDGPYTEALIFRAMTFGMMIFFTLLGFGLHVLGMFFIGAGLYAAGVFAPGRLAWHRTAIVLGLLVGLPVVLLGVYGHRLTGEGMPLWLMGALNMLGGPLMSLAYLGAAVLLAASGAVPVIVRAISRVGRMALTNYLTETTVATFIMYHWGLGWFGSVYPAQQVLIVVCVYGALIITSAIWLRFFQFGPMEWLWRTVTYWRPQPLLRERTTDN